MSNTQINCSEIPEEELYDLFWYIADYIYPRLKCFYEATQGQYPSNLTQETWNGILQRMINAFDLLDNKDNTTPEEDKIIEEGLHLFAKWYRDLWC